MNLLFSLLLVAVVFAAVAYGCWWILTRFKAPVPAFWVVGVILLIILLFFLLGQFGNGQGFHFTLNG